MGGSQNYSRARLGLELRQLKAAHERKNYGSTEHLKVTIAGRGRR